MGETGETRVTPDGGLAVGRVLVVEDDEDLRDMLVDALTDEGYAVEAAADGAAALALLDELAASGNVVQGILLDMRMPVMGGAMFAEEYRKRPGPHAPIVVITASKGLAEAAREVEPADVVRKPFALPDLLGRLAAALAAGR